MSLFSKLCDMQNDHVIASLPIALNCVTMWKFVTYTFMFRIQRVPHRRHNFRHFAKAGTWVLSLDGGLSITEEKGICRHRPGSKITNLHNEKPRTNIDITFLHRMVNGIPDCTTIITKIFMTALLKITINIYTFIAISNGDYAWITKWEDNVLSYQLIVYVAGQNCFVEFFCI